LTFRLENPVTVNLSRAPHAFRYVGPNEYDQPVSTEVQRRPPPRAPVYGPYPYGYPYPYPYGWGGYYPYYGGVGIVIRGGRWGRRW